MKVEIVAALTPDDEQVVEIDFPSGASLVIATPADDFEVTAYAIPSVGDGEHAHADKATQLMRFVWSFLKEQLDAEKRNASIKEVPRGE